MPIEATLRLARALRGGDDEPRKTTPQITALRDPEALARAMEFRESVMYPEYGKRPIDEQASWYSAAGYTPQDVRGGMKGITSSPTAIAKASEMAMGMGPGATVFHGSPHKFEKFDAAKIGTGEGAQAYGHGLYFAENPEVSKAYARGLGKVEIGGGKMSWDDPAHVAAYQVHLMGGDMAKAADELYRASHHRTSMASPQVAKQASELLDNILTNKTIKKTERGAHIPPVKQGEFYHVDLPDEQIARMIDWDKPLSAQGEAVQKALQPALQQLEQKKRDLMRAFPAGEVEGEIAKWRSGISGQSLLDEVGAFSGRSEPQASEYLRELGIPGIRYLDQGSRNMAALGIEKGTHLDGSPRFTVNGPKGDVHFDTMKAAQDYVAKNQSGATSNFVVFNPEILKILRRE